MLEDVIKVENLRKVYRIGEDRVAALHNINISIPAGEVCCVVGVSGSGKSTLLNMLAGLEKPTRGKVLIDKQDITQMNEEELALFRQHNLGFIFQSYNLLPQLTALENVALPLMFSGMEKGKRLALAEAQLKTMGLGPRKKHKPTEMSGGQQQRVGIARAFVTRPKVIFADEPTGNLDTTTTLQVLKAMLDHAKEYNSTFVMVTHEAELSMSADRIITLKDGHIIKDERLNADVKAARRKELFAGLPQNVG